MRNTFLGCLSYTCAMLEHQPHLPEHRKLPELPKPSFDEIEDVDDAREYVQELISAGRRPIITIPEEYIENVLSYGITSVPKHDLMSGKKFSFVAGTIGLDPYLPEAEERRVFEINPDMVRIEPRITGSDKKFHGVIGFPDGIPASALIPLGSYSASSWEERGRDNEKGSLH